MLQLEKIEIRHQGFALEADWTVPKGAKVAIVGPSGAGKSTLLSVIAGFTSPQSGRVLWEGQDLASIGPGERPLSILFQDQNLFPHLSVAQNLGLGLRPDLRLSSTQKDMISSALAWVGLSDLADRKPGQLSGGQAGRAALARALLRRRPILLLDEPFAALGPALKSEMLDLVNRIADEADATVLMVTHDPQDAQSFSDLTVLVADGKAHEPIPTGDIFADPPPALRAYLGF